MPTANSPSDACFHCTMGNKFAFGSMRFQHASNAPWETNLHSVQNAAARVELPEGRPYSGTGHCQSIAHTIVPFWSTCASIAAQALAAQAPPNNEQAFTCCSSPPPNEQAFNCGACVLCALDAVHVNRCIPSRVSSSHRVATATGTAPAGMLPTCYSETTRGPACFS